MNFDDNLIPAQEISSSDLFIFLASPQSLADTSLSNSEFTIAYNQRIKKRRPLAIIRLENCELPDFITPYYFETMQWRSRRKDVDKIMDGIKKKLDKSFSISTIQKEGVQIFVSEMRPDELVDRLISRDSRGVFFISSAFRAVEMGRLIKYINQSAADTKRAVVNNLIDIFMHDSTEMAMARQNAIFMLGKLLPADQMPVRDLQKRMPSHETPFVFRGFHVGISFSDIDPMIAYAKNLAFSPNPEWDTQRVVNMNYHSIYYGSTEGAREDLRSSIRNLTHNNLLSLNVVTLGHIGNSKMDAEILGMQRSSLEMRGVDRVIIDNSIRLINNRIM
ncbi:MAG: toll/interleukin-1 receptor domain-containing protein [Phycisphaerales bacterium]|nr:toll/interleukin-1 receptor domain-containing protein [Phycisphaerales bacterium]